MLGISQGGRFAVERQCNVGKAPFLDVVVFVADATTTRLVFKKKWKFAV